MNTNDSAGHIMGARFQQQSAARERATARIRYASAPEIAKRAATHRANAEASMKLARLCASGNALALAMSTEAEATAEAMRSYEQAYGEEN